MYSHLATSSRAEAEVFAIDYADFPRMQFVWDAWFDFLLLTMGGPIFYSREAIERERTRRLELMAEERAQAVRNLRQGSRRAHQPPSRGDVLEGLVLDGARGARHLSR
jgi:hypothetical protein